MGFNSAFKGLMWKNTVEPGWSQMTMRRMRIAGWIPKATNTHSEYVTIIAFPLQQWLHEGTSMLCYEHIACLGPHTAIVAMSTRSLPTP